MTDYHTDPDGKKWERIQTFPDVITNGQRWVLERHEPEMEEWVRKEDVVNLQAFRDSLLGWPEWVDRLTSRTLPKSEPWR